MTDSFATRDTLDVGGKKYTIASLAKLGQKFDISRLPYSMKILLENLLRHEDGVNVTGKEIEAVAKWAVSACPAATTPKSRKPACDTPERPISRFTLCWPRVALAGLVSVPSPPFVPLALTACSDFERQL